MWRPLEAFSDARVPKLALLARALKLRLEVPPTVWLPAHEALTYPDLAHALPPSMTGWVIRSASPDEDGRETSNAGQFLSLHVAPDATPEARREALGRVAASVVGPRGGAVFVQPKVTGGAAGVAFFDGYWFERTEAAASNVALTHGEARGEVVRGHVRERDAWHAFLEAAQRVLPGQAIDVEYVREGERFVLLQVRPALFAIRRNPLLSMANHREILGEVPSPWIVSVLEIAGRRVVDWFAAVDPEIARWDETYAVVVHGRPWMNFSFFLRLLNHWGLPERWMTRSVGGGSPELEGASSAFQIRRLRPLRLLALQARGLRRIAAIPGRLAALHAQVDGARTPVALMDANIAAMDFAITTNFAIAGVLTGLRWLKRDSPADVVTRRMMDAFDALRRSPASERRHGLDAWLAAHGHRGPLESDPERPRFRELKAKLEAELGLEPTAPPQRRPARGREADTPRPAGAHLLGRPEVLREQFRDDLMHLWEKLRARALELGESLVQAGHLDAPEAIFLLDRAALAGPVNAFAGLVSASREARTRHELMSLPVTAPLDALLAMEAGAAPAGELRGIGLGRGLVRGTIRRARELDELLGTARGEDEVLLVPSLEPSWAVLFPRFVAVVSELGGELSHAAILLRESGRPAVVDCRGVFAALATGDRVEVDVGRGVVRKASD